MVNNYYLLDHPFFIGFLTLIIDWKFFYSLAYLFYGGIILLLISVLLTGSVTSGATSWFEIGSLKLQPSEFAKFTTALAVAKYYNNIYIKKISWLNKFKIYAIILVPITLIILQNDLGTALVFFAFILVLYREGMSGNILILILIVGILFILTLLVNKFLLTSILSIIIIFF